LKARKIIQVGNVCALCEETYPRSALYTCSRCGMIYCGNCILPRGDGIICLKCAVKEVSPRSSRSKYMNLSIFLAKKARFLSETTLSFQEIEEIIGDRLPESARKQKGWWSNIRGRMPSEAWLTVGWMVKEVDLEEGRVTFIRERSAGSEDDNANSDEVKRSPGKSKQFKTLAFKARASIRKPRKISKTKIAILQARLKNIERARQSGERRRAR